MKPQQNQNGKTPESSLARLGVLVGPDRKLDGIQFTCPAEVNILHESVWELFPFFSRIWAAVGLPYEIKKGDEIELGKRESIMPFYLYHAGTRCGSGRAGGAVPLSRSEAVTCFSVFQEHKLFGDPRINTHSIAEEEAMKEAWKHTDLRPFLPSTHEHSARVVDEELFGIDFDFCGQAIEGDVAAIIGEDRCESVHVGVTRWGKFDIILNRLTVTAGSRREDVPRSEVAELLCRLGAHPDFQCSHISTRKGPLTENDLDPFPHAISSFRIGDAVSWPHCNGARGARS